MTTTVVSAPGKVLIAGGYLILDQKYTGLVISASSRFYAVIQDCQQPGQAGQIIVRSPQFIGAEWTYSVTIHDDGTVDVSQTSESKNKFVYYALKYTLIVASERLSSVGSARSLRDSLQHGLDIAAVGDNDFYSQQAKLRELNLPSTVASLASITPFCPQDVRLDNVNKTGMGSSAALITSVVSALLLRFKVITREEFYRPDSDARKLAHNTAQFVHCFAQGKVGSGFDVSAAVFGSQLYTRFNPVLLDGLMKGGDVSPMLPLSPALSPGGQWDYRMVPIQLPPLVRLLLADVSAGSDTPSLASKVLKWRQEKADEADALWAAIDTSNQTLATQLRHLFDLHERQSDLYASAVNRMSSAPLSEWLGGATPSERSVVQAFLDLRKTSENTRALMRQMGKAAGDDVHIEPDTQTELLDASIAQKGVICGGVPGAGGYDAIWLLVFEPNNGTSEPLSAVEKLWEQFPNVSPLLATESKDGGAKVEDIDKVPGLRAVVQIRR
ncbi:ribosomal protein S5 domain 2-type protein [Boletus edulis BED1]|uniref:Phosphomevalonate kinase n=1 Tax=Boletus edulis BED1 TaxID=1328754 RepID=A0AAD4GFX6_BOLED|nr:ribosomal protein S5 domain 2-type protein [Boletus edulis BED1]